MNKYYLIQAKYQQKHRASKFKKNKYKPQKHKLLGTLLHHATNPLSRLKTRRITITFKNQKYK
ncbi:MAG: hypothetical protein ACQKHC_01545 [Candidatus Phytoplasma pruni]|uniref:hypothetical protein n=1 Tax=Milkweed yellows phytoplasma TaxID=208434 RepID=UPI0004B76D44|nr:hypothetical protein [Milkweed yellows phytoplasma]